MSAPPLIDATADDAARLRAVYGCFPSGVTALCAEVGGEAVGIVATSFTAVSLDPPLVSVCIQNSSRTWPRLRSVARLGVSVLGSEQEDICRTLARKDGDRFDGVGRVRSDHGAIFIDDAVAVFDCTLHAELPAGDHTIVLLQIHRMYGDTDTGPLVFHRSIFRRLVDS